jgi:hypothetical protein
MKRSSLYCRLMLQPLHPAISPFSTMKNQAIPQKNKKDHFLDLNQRYVS